MLGKDVEAKELMKAMLVYVVRRYDVGQGC